MKNLFKLLGKLFSLEIQDIDFEKKKVAPEESLITDYKDINYPLCTVCLAHSDLSELLNLNIMKQAIVLFALFTSMNVLAQVNYQKKTLYKYDKEDGWVRIMEASGFNINANGDTTFWTEVKEDTQQDDPGIKPTTVAIVIPSSVFTIGTPVKVVVKDTINKWSKPPVIPIKQDVAAIYVHSFSTDTVNKVVYKKYHSKKFKYKNRWRTKYKKTPKVRKVKYPVIKDESTEPIKIITYKKRLWITLKADNTLSVVEALTKNDVIKKIGSSYISITQFSDYSIIRE